MWEIDTSRKQATYKTEAIEIFVTKNHMHNPGQWVMNCKELDFLCKDLYLEGTAPIEVAQSFAINACRKKIEGMMKALPGSLAMY